MDLVMKTRIIYEDESVLVVYKPAGLATQTARVGQADVVSELQNYLYSKSKGVPYLGIVHRLDQPVEGVLVFAKDKLSAGRLSAQLLEGTLNKQYYAVVHGAPEQETGELVDYLVKDGRTQLTKVVTGQSKVPDGDERVGNCEGQKAILQYYVRGQLSTAEPISLLDIHIDTGRFHQIRAQLAHAKLPILGDSKYGTADSMDISRRFYVKNVALCAYQIAFRHPVTKKKMEYTITPEAEIFSRFKIS